VRGKLRKKDLMKVLGSQSFSDCALAAYRNRNIYEFEASIKFIDALNSLDTKIKNERKRIVDSLSTFVGDIFICARQFS